MNIVDPKFEDGKGWENESQFLLVDVLTYAACLGHLFFPVKE
jgi:hypothetical protein